ncbi:uncharacterized protein LOC126777477 [Nymphalis io]|uniref:uncharacterized protein LOC126777477 n=1 Tax=Inachis io TaxID=171585 RepID=UPI002169065A|nr:uncharacterized protein LOC126777477 [Nymphalis io]
MRRLFQHSDRMKNLATSRDGCIKSTNWATCTDGTTKIDSSSCRYVVEGRLETVQYTTATILRPAIRDRLPRGEERTPLLQLQEGVTFNRRNVTPVEEKVMKQRTARCHAARCAIARVTRLPAAGMRPALHTKKCRTAATNQAPIAALIAVGHGIHRMAECYQLILPVLHIRLVRVHSDQESSWSTVVKKGRKGKKPSPTAVVPTTASPIEPIAPQAPKPKLATTRTAAVIVTLQPDWTVDLRLTSLDDSVTREKLIAAVARKGS